MDDPAKLKSARRARWLSELAEALAEAERLASRLPPGDAAAPDTGELSSRIRAAMDEVEALRRGLAAATEISPKRRKRPRPDWPDGAGQR